MQTGMPKKIIYNIKVKIAIITCNVNGKMHGKITFSV